MYSKQTHSNQNSSNSAHSIATNFAPPKFSVQPQTQEGVQQQEPISAEEVEKIRAAGSNWPDVAMFTTNRPAPAPKPRIQMKLSIGKTNDKYEREADQVAQKVVQNIHTSQNQTVQTKEQKDEEGINKKPLVTNIQRQESEEETPINAKRDSVDGEMVASEHLETSIQQAKGSGQPLANSIQKPMEQAFGTDFSGVKVHTDTQSDQMNQSIQAKAFTTGQDIFFKSGEYNPDSKTGQELIAHELTHVVQQTGSISRKQEAKSVSQITPTQQAHLSIQRNKDDKEVSSTAMKRLQYAEEAIKHTKGVLKFGAGNQKMALLISNMNTYYRTEVMRNANSWIISDDVKDLAAANPEALTAAKADIIAGGNCGEHAEVVFNYLRVSAKGEKINLSDAGDEDHAFVLLGEQGKEKDSEIVVADAWPLQPKATLWEDHFIYEHRNKLNIKRSMTADGDNVKQVIAAGLKIHPAAAQYAKQSLRADQADEKIEQGIKDEWVWNIKSNFAEGKEATKYYKNNEQEEKEYLDPQQDANKNSGRARSDSDESVDDDWDW